MLMHFMEIIKSQSIKYHEFYIPRSALFLLFSDMEVGGTNGKKVQIFPIEIFFKYSRTTQILISD